MDIGQINVAADQVAPERQAQGRAPAPRPVERGSSGVSDADTTLARALATEALGPDLAPPNELRLRVEEDIDMVVAQVVNSETKEVVREIPPEELVQTAKRLNAIIGQILDREV